MKNLFCCLSAFVCIAVLSGCASFQYEGEKLAPNKDRIILFNATQPPAPAMWKVIGVGAIKQNANWCTDQTLLLKLREHAQEVGADAIHVLSIRMVPVDQGAYPETSAEVFAGNEDGTQTGWTLLSQDFGNAESGYATNDPMTREAPQEFDYVIRAEFLTRITDNVKCGSEELTTPAEVSAQEPQATSTEEVTAK